MNKELRCSRNLKEEQEESVARMITVSDRILVGFHGRSASSVKIFFFRKWITEKCWNPESNWGAAESESLDFTLRYLCVYLVRDFVKARTKQCI